MPSTFPERKSDWNSPTAPSSHVYQFRSADWNGILDHVTGWVNAASWGVTYGGSTDEAAHLASAAADAASQGVGLLIGGKVRISSAAGTISAPIRFEGGGSLDLQTGGSVTLSGPLTAGVQRVFWSNGGTLTFSAKVKEVLPQWWGAALDGSTTDTAPLQAALNAGANRRVFVSASTVIDSVLVIGSNTWLDVAPAATVTFKAGSTGNMLKNTAVSTVQRSVTDAGITIGTTTLTSATANFTSADVGRTVTIAGAGPGGGEVKSANPLVLSATITVFTNSTTVTVSSPALHTVTGAAASIYDRDVNIRVTGGTWDRGTAGSSSPVTTQHTLLFRRVDGLTIEDAKVATGAAKFAVSVADATKLNAQRLDFDAFSDGIHVSGPASDIVIRDITGTTGDDVVAFTAVDWDSVVDVGGDISSVVVDGISSDSTTSQVKIIGGTGTTIRNVTLRNIVGSGAQAMIIGDDQTGATNIAGLLIDGVNVASSGLNQINLSASAGKDITIRNLQASSVSGASRTMISVTGSLESLTVDGVFNASVYAGIALNVVNLANSGTPSIGSLTVSRVSLGSASVNGVVYINAPATVTNLALSDVNLTCAAAAGGDTVLNIYGTVGQYQLSNVSMTKGSSLLYYQSGATVGPGTLHNIYQNGTSRFANFLNAAGADISVSNYAATGLVSAAVYTNGAAVTLRGAGVQRLTAWNGIQRNAAEVVHIINSDWPADISLLTPASGDRCYNTSAGVIQLAGPVMSDGVGWRRIDTVMRTAITQTGGGSKTPDINNQITRYQVTDATAFTIANPTGGTTGTVFTIDVTNASGGVMGAITWGAAYKFAGAAAPAVPANGRNTSVTFYTENGPAYRELTRAVDVSN